MDDPEAQNSRQKLMVSDLEIQKQGAMEQNVSVATGRRALSNTTIPSYGLWSESLIRIARIHVSNLHNWLYKSQTTQAK